MRKLFYSILLLSATTSYAQKKVECTKSTINVDGVVVADYDSKGGVFSDRKLWVFLPNTKDTLIKIIQSSINLDHPMVESAPMVYLATFFNPEKTLVYFTDPPGWGFVKAKKFITILFNDNLPSLIKDNKISMDGIKAFNDKNVFNVDLMRKQIQQINDTIVAAKNLIPQRDKQKTFTYTNIGKNVLPRLYKSVQLHSYNTYEVRQDGILVGILEKEFLNPGGSFAKCVYNFYKKVSPFKIGENTIEYVPVATEALSPGVTSGVSSMPIRLKLIGLNKTLDGKGVQYDGAENEMMSMLVATAIL